METEQELEPNGETSESANDPYGEADLKKRVGVAARVAAEAGEFKAQAFDKVLDRLLGTPLTVVEEGVPVIAPKAESAPARTPKKAQRRSPKTPAAALDRIKPVMDADPEIVAEWAEKIEKLPSYYKAHGVLAFARKLNVDGLTIPELREIITNKLRVGVPDGTLKGSLSKASATEIGRNKNESGDTVYKILRAGEDALSKAPSTNGQGKQPNE